MRCSVIILLIVCSAVYGSVHVFDSAANQPQATGQVFDSVANQPQATEQVFHSAANQPQATGQVFDSAANQPQATVNGRAKLPKRPQPQLNLIVDQIMGKWYFQARLSPCSWSGSDAFEDWTQELTKDSKSMISTERWDLEGDCATLNARHFQNQQNKGCFTVKDSFGGLMSGSMVMAATDYTSFAISWTCVKMSGDGEKCVDASVLVKTREPNPSPRTWKMADAILRKLWNMAITDMEQISHTGVCG